MEKNSTAGAPVSPLLDEHPSAAELSEATTQLRSNRASWYTLVLLLTFAPLAFGAVEFWAVRILEILALVIGLSWTLRAISQGQIRFELSSTVCAAIGLQVWTAMQLVLRWTADPSATRDSLTLLFSYFLVFCVVANENWSRRWIRRLALAIAIIGFLVAVFGIVQFFSWNGKLYWIRAIRQGSPFGPYVNRNHFAGLMEMTFPVGMSLVFSRSLGRIWKGLLTFFGVVMALATLLSLSRGGIVSFGLSLAAFAYLFSTRRESKSTLLWIGILCASCFAWLAWLGAEPLLQRILNLQGLAQEASFRDRITFAKDTLQIIRDHPYKGTGLGTFGLMIPLYSSLQTRLSIGQAHNDYLQLLSEVGLIGSSFAVVWFVGFIGSALRSIRDRAQAFSPLRVGAFCGCLAILIHSLVDFNLQIPANALYFSVLAGLASRTDLAMRSSPGTKQFEDSHRGTPEKTHRLN